MLKSIIKLLRVKHYIKNILIFVPLFFSQQLLEPHKFIQACLGFVSFCLISSAVYVINDIQDTEKDRLHPTKRNRPLASGAISKLTAVTLAVICMIVSLGINVLAQSFYGTALVLLYFALNIAYSMGLKNKPLIDVAILTSGFLIRVIYGATITQISISGWLYFTVISGAFYLGLGKRRNELQKQGSTGTTRAVLKYYTYAFLDKNMYVCLGLTDVFYALWAMSKDNEQIIWTVPVIMLILMKYSLDIEGNSDGDPVEVILHDKALLMLCVIYAFFIIGILYC